MTRGTESRTQGTNILIKKKEIEKGSLRRKLIIIHSYGTSLVVQWLGLHAFIAGGTSSIPCWGTKMHAHVCVCVCVSVCGTARKNKKNFLNTCII